MATDNIHARKDEKQFINVHDPFELRYWSNKYGVTKDHILEAVKAEGPSQEFVERYLKNKNIHLSKPY
jgi:hypothetical protein